MTVGNELDFPLRGRGHCIQAAELFGDHAGSGRCFCRISGLSKQIDSQPWRRSGNRLRRGERPGREWRAPWASAGGVAYRSAD